MEVSKARIRNGINIESPRVRWKVGAVHFPTNGRTARERERERARGMKASPSKSEPSNSGRSFKLCRGFVLKIVRFYPLFIQPTGAHRRRINRLIPIVGNFIIK